MLDSVPWSSDLMLFYGLYVVQLRCYSFDEVSITNKVCSMRRYYIVFSGVYSEDELHEYGLVYEPKTATYGCIDDDLSEDYVSSVVGNYHFGLDVGIDKPSWLVLL